MTPKSQFIHAYIETALWSSQDDDGIPLDRNYGPSDISKRTLNKMRVEAGRFWEENKALISHNAAQAGHDFWLTRNRHGAGFKDGDWPEPAASKLYAAAHRFREASLYVSENGSIQQLEALSVPGRRGLR